MSILIAFSSFACFKNCLWNTFDKLIVIYSTYCYFNRLSVFSISLRYVFSTVVRFHRKSVAANSSAVVKVVISQLSQPMTMTSCATLREHLVVTLSMRHIIGVKWW